MISRSIRTKSKGAVRTRLSAAAVLILCVGAYAASDIWSGTPTDGLWQMPANWVGNQVPGAVGTTNSGDVATFNLNTTQSVISVDSGRNILGINFGGAGMTSFYTIGSAGANAGNSLTLTDGGAITGDNTSSDKTVNAPLVLAGTGGSYTFTGDMTASTNRELTIGGSVTGSATAGNTKVLTLNGAGLGVNTINNAISDGLNGGNLAVVKNGVGLWQLNAANPYTGGTTVTNGELRASGAGTNPNIGSGPVTLNGGFLRFQNNSSVGFTNAVTANGGAISFRGGGTFNPTSFAGTALTLTGDLNTTVTSTDFKNFTGTLNVGTGTGVFLRLGTGFVQSSLQNAAVNLAASAILNQQAGTNGTMNVLIGTLSGASGSTVGGSAAGGGVFRYNVGSRNENSTFDGIIQNGGTSTGLVKVGTGTLALSGANTFTGATDINAGTLQVSAGGSIGTSAQITVNSGGTLAGSGGINFTRLNPGGAIAPGINGIGTLTSSGGSKLLEWGGDFAGTNFGQMKFQLSSLDAFSDRITGLDLLTKATVSGTTEFRFDFQNSGAAGQTYTLLQFGALGDINGLGPFTSSDFTFVNLASGLTGTFSLTSNALTFTTAPEPGAAVLLLGGLGLVGSLRHHRQR